MTLNPIHQSFKGKSRAQGTRKASKLGQPGLADFHNRHALWHPVGASKKRRRRRRRRQTEPPARASAFQLECSNFDNLPIIVSRLKCLGLRVGPVPLQSSDSQLLESCGIRLLGETGGAIRSLSVMARDCGWDSPTLLLPSSSSTNGPSPRHGWC